MRSLKIVFSAFYLQTKVVNSNIYRETAGRSHNMGKQEEGGGLVVNLNLYILV